MGNRPPAGHHEGEMLGINLARQLENAAGTADQLVEAFQPRIVKRRAIGLAVERKDRLDFEPQIERDLGRDLV